ncbi:MAG: T9SS C-terminal target domain-containing protein [Calditrichaeota bacterium]|nr:MAG: T9SS C-terminal target domain-containing protein [Calditrichota bacterium]
MDRFWEKNGDTLTVTGKVFEDTTYFYPIFFLDIDADSLPDYGLNFGPPWFQPANGSVRPEHGEIVTIFGRVHSGMLGFQMLMVSQINGEEWQPLDAPASWAGSWMLRNHSDSTFVFCANDSSNWLGFAPGHMGSGMGGMGGMRWPDSTFMQFWEIYPDSLPGGHMSENFMGFYANILDPAGNSMMGGSMWGGNNWGGHHGWMNFEKNHQLHFQYREEDLHSYGFNENTVELHYWDPSQDSWKKANNAVVNTSENTVSLTSNEIYTYYTLRAVKTTTGVKTASRTVPAVKLYSNYPNPFNPETSISFEMITGGQVRLDIYNIAGQHLLTLLNEVRDAGSHLIKWNGRDFKGKQMPSGIYLLKIQANEQSAIQRMTLLK